MSEKKHPTEYKPKCPKCGGINFIAINDQYLQNADKTVALIVCSTGDCETVVGVLPYEAVWDK